ncbi:YfcE family phosphodiesterase [Treponema sp. OMZ 857]|uniref:YfcE family phosphodiesterase n=1 Tax=Treponema sp. OMZ 857 TaxID=1643513 RepID=UPI0020A4FD9F|nr:YfcE family phosphodiesterase [Treponema sp. OMZ 857]UTC42762.1 YfcE family phosphodiesterase [Treponema sp. OMZ 857]
MNRFTRCENGIIADAVFYNRLQYADTASVLLLSDTHGAVDAVRWILSAFSEECQACLFTGDGAQDIITVVREAAAGRITIPPVIIMAQGNCDSQLYPPVFPGCENPKPFGLPVYQQKMIAGQQILLAHGHLHHVELDGRKLSMTAENLGCTIAVYGHTHIQSIECFGGVTAVNPGSPLRPRGKSYGGFALLSLRTGQAGSPEDTATGDSSVTGLFSKVQFYQLIRESDGAFSASAHAVYPIPIRQSAGD